jgi:hypothetical protein
MNRLKKQLELEHVACNCSRQHLLFVFLGIHVLTLSERLALHLNGINIGVTSESAQELQKLNEENACLRSLIAHINDNGHSSQLIQCLSDIFRCEQERRLAQIQQHPNFDRLEHEIRQMCHYQRDALSKIVSQDRLTLINELDQTKQQLIQLKQRLEQLKQSPSQDHTNRYYLKYVRCENHRRSLVYQKRYLLVLLTGYEDTENYALHEIRRLTGDTKSTSFLLANNNDRMKLLPRQSYYRRSLNYRFRFRSYVRVVITIIRMRRMVRKWTQKQLTIK